jgi:predicted AAA+ superfamily ATPase
MWQRLAQQRLEHLSKEFPAIVILGSRQVGKTTLVRESFPEAEYKDLESPLVRERFSSDPAHELSRLGSFTILDEAQSVPEIYQALRGVIDERRKDRMCHFCILGSAQPALVRGVSESLAGRVGLVTLDPLTPCETGLAIHEHWLKGGFPDALHGDFRSWWEPYLEAVLRRDLASYGYRPEPIFLRRLLTMLAAQQGGLMNLSALGNALGVSYHTVRHGLDLLEGVFLLRTLHPFHRNIGKRLVKSPRVFLRDTGLLHHLLHIGSSDQLENHPVRGMSWEGFVIEDLIRREQVRNPLTKFYFWRTGTGNEADLIMDRGSERIAFEIKANSGTDANDARKLEAQLDDIGAVRGYVMGMGALPQQLTDRVWNQSLDLDPCWLP